MKKYMFQEAERAVLEKLCVPLAVYQFIDRRVVTLLVSDGFCEVFGFSSHEQAMDLMDRDMYRYTHPDDVSGAANAAFRFATEGGRFEPVYRSRTEASPEYHIIHAFGEHRHTETGERLAYVWYVDEGVYMGEGMEGADTEENRIRLSASMNRLMREDGMIQESIYDYLTGLPSMTYFFQLAEAERARHRAGNIRTAVLFVDLSGMKLFNLNYGFAEGDRLLKETARVLASHFSSENCCRLGQDHFAVCTQAEHVEDELLEVFDECAQINGGRNLPLRVGICQDHLAEVSVSAACDRAKYAADAIRNAYVSEYHYYEEEMVQEAEKRQYILDNLDRALEEKWIRVYFQPIIRAANGRVCDEEALARWIDPIKGFLPPSEFIPVLEASRLIYRLDLYVAEEILRKMKRQQEEGLYVVPQSVNLSRSDFDACDIVEEIRRRVDESGISREKLTIEITESVIGSDFEFMKSQIQRFQKLGFHVWMDDFGSGYSSLDLLQNIRFDLIKLDMRFMQQFGKSEESRIIVTELIRMALRLGVETVCEGVEEKEQADFLREVGCTKLQGFYFSRPVPEETILERKEKGTLIGFENPDETDYYAALGRINLYDMEVLASEERESLSHYSDALPMAVYESNGEIFTLLRCNRPFRAMSEKIFGTVGMGVTQTFESMEGRIGSGMISGVRQCGKDGNRLVIDEELPDGSRAHAFFKRISVNPVSGRSAVACVVMSVVESVRNIEGINYLQIARALTSDYFQLFYVNMKTKRFVEYRAESVNSELIVERHGDDFFASAHRDMTSQIYGADQETMVHALSRESMEKALNEQGNFTLTYRVNSEKGPVYMALKAVRMSYGDDHIVIGVSNVDAQMKEREALKRIRDEQMTYSRLTALGGDYICIYTVDPETEDYVEYAVKEEYEGLGLAKQGKQFFHSAAENIRDTVFPEDQEMLYSLFTRENVMREIRENGLFALRYRLMIRGKPVYVALRAVIVQEKEEPKMLVGITNVDAQVARERKYQRILLEEGPSSGPGGENVSSPGNPE